MEIEEQRPRPVERNYHVASQPAVGLKYLMIFSWHFVFEILSHSWLKFNNGTLFLKYLVVAAKVKL